MVYIVDFGNGVDVTHPALASLPGIIYANPIDNTVDGIDEDKDGYTDDVYGWDFYHNQEDPYPDGDDPYPWHDTAVTGIMASNGTNGAYGICRTAHVIVLKKHLADYYTDPTVINQIVAGLNYAVNFKREIEGVVGHSVHMVINNSYPVLVGTADWSRHPELQAAIDNAAASDIGMFFAATNSSQSNDDPNTAAYPASYN
ncbi:MAG: S8 family serine peptidase, partial [Pseudomonadota bacterium]|nr:S8 family serine peptidase [Pseudomonadota bacterium]